MPGTVIHGLPYPAQLPAGPGPDVPADVKALADAIDTRLTPFAKGLLADRPAFGKAGRRYWGTDTLREYLDLGTAWADVGAVPITEDMLDATVLNLFLPLGAVIDYAVNGGDPAGGRFMVPDGRPLNSTADATLAPLFAKIGTQHGGTGANNFFLPDYRGVYLAGANAMGTRGDAGAGNDRINAAFGASVGERAHALSAAESGTNPNGQVNINHTHPSSADGPAFLYGEGGGGADNFEFAAGVDTADVRKAANVTGNGGGVKNLTGRGADNSHENRPPTRVCHKLIRVR